jgi:hypothetical protein
MNFQFSIKKTKYGQEGFSTLEMLMAMTILILFVLVPVVLVSFGTQSLGSDSQTGDEALNIAQDLLEQQQALARKDFNLVNSATSTMDGIYTKKVDVSQIDLFTKKITATVTWSLDHNRSAKTTLNALVANFNAVAGGDACSSILSDTDGSGNIIHSDWTRPNIVNTGSTNLATLSGDGAGQYIITGMSAYVDQNTSQKKLFLTANNLVSGNAEQLLLGPKFAGTGADDNSNSSTLSAWSNPGRVTASDSSYASVTLSGTKETHYLKAANFGFNIPARDSITGIIVQVKRGYSGSTGSVKDSQIKIVKSSGAIGITNKSTGSTWSSSETVSFGSQSELWGETWTPADINSANFGVAVAAVGSSGTTKTANVDSVQITVYYQKPTFYIVDVTNPAAPAFVNSIDNDPVDATGLKAVATDGHYAYVASASSFTNGQLQVIDVSVNPPVVKTTFKIAAVTGSSTQGIGNSIFYKDGYIYLGLTKTTNNSGAGGMEFDIIDANKVLTDPTNAFKGSYDAKNTVNDIFVKDGYAFLTTTSATENLTILNVSNPANPTRVGGFFAAGNGAKSLAVVGNAVYLGRNYGTNEFFVLNAGDLANPVEFPPSSHLDIGTGSQTSINGILNRNYLAFLMDSGGQFEVWRVDNPGTSIVRWDAIPANQISVPSGTDNTPLACIGNYIYATWVDASNNGYISIITGQ